MVKVKRIKNSFIYVGRNAKQKRIDLVANFFDDLLANFPGITCRFVIAGDAPIAVLNLIETYGKRVVIELNLSNSKVLHRLCASEYFVVLSDFEGYCMAAYEAVQAGCFLIYRDVGEIKNYVLQNRSFEVLASENAYQQFREVLEERIYIDSDEVEPAKLTFQGRAIDTYNSRFIAII